MSWTCIHLLNSVQHLVSRQLLSKNLVWCFHPTTKFPLISSTRHGMSSGPLSPNLWIFFNKLMSSGSLLSNLLVAFKMLCTACHVERNLPLVPCKCVYSYHLSQLVSLGMACQTSFEFGLANHLTRHIMLSHLPQEILPHVNMTCRHAFDQNWKCILITIYLLGFRIA